MTALHFTNEQIIDQKFRIPVEGKRQEQGEERRAKREIKM